MNSPTSQCNSVGNGPEPTRVQYALKIPITLPIFVGATPKPVQVPAVTVLEEVTNGYVPKSTSNIVPCAPSANTFLLFFNASLMYCSLSIAVNCFNTSIPSNQGCSTSLKSY